MELIGLLDCNNFFASCERAFNPKLRTLPVAVLSNNDGCIVARSNEVKKLGIPMGAPYFKYKDVIEANNVQIFSSNFKLYSDMSRRVMSILFRYIDDVEIYSIDESFFRIDIASDSARDSLLRNIREDVLKSTGIPVSIGLAKTKTLAKLASELCKKSDSNPGFLDLSVFSDTEKKVAFESVEIGDVWGIGRKLSERFNAEGIFNVYEFINMDGGSVRHLANVALYRTHLELRGTPAIGFNTPHVTSKSIASTRSFGVPVKDYKRLKEAVVEYVSIATGRLRVQKSLASGIYVFILTNPFKKGERFYSNGVYITLDFPSSDTRDFVKSALEGLEKIFLAGLEYKKAGVILSSIIPSTSMQYSLFYRIDEIEASNNLMATVDRVNQRWGKSTIRLASAGFRQDWKVKSNLLSPRYTTSWDELLIVK